MNNDLLDEAGNLLKVGDRVELVGSENWKGIFGTIIKTFPDTGMASMLPDKPSINEYGEKLQASAYKQGLTFYAYKYLVIKPNKEPNKEDYSNVPNFGEF